MLEEKGVDILPITQPVEFSLESEEEYDVEMAKRKGRDPVE